VHGEGCSLFVHVNKGRDALIQEVKHAGVLRASESKQEFLSRRLNERIESYVSKSLHGNYMVISLTRR